MALIVGIAGGSASGKSFIAENAVKAMGQRAVAVSQDMFYREASEIPETEGLKNFDCPQAFDWPLIKEAIMCFKNGENAIVPEYNYTLGRIGYRTVAPREVVIFEGILAFQNSEISKIFDCRFFVNAPEKTRLERRMERDCNARAISKEEVELRFFRHVLKAHRRFVQPQEKNANIVLDGTDKREFERVVREIEKISAVSRTQPDSIEIESYWEELSSI